VEPLNRRQWAFLEVVASRLVPALDDLDGGARERFRAIVGDALGERPAATRRQFSAFLAVLRWLPLLRFGAPFERLPPRRKDRVLRWFQDCPVVRLRQGFWGLKTLVFMGHYARPEIAASLHYAPSFDGNGKLHA
jgi:hypothetical protein